MRRLILPVLSALALGTSSPAAAGPLRDLWAGLLGAVSAEERVQEAITDSLDQLGQLHGPDLAARVRADFLAAELKKHLEPTISEVKNISVELSDQAIVVGADFEYQIPRLNVPVRGRVAGLIAMSFDDNDLVLRPALDAIDIEQVGPFATGNGVIDDIMTGLLEQSSQLFLDTLNGKLSALAPYRLRFDPTAELPTPAAEGAPLTGATTRFGLGSPVLLVDPSGITVVADVRVSAATAQSMEAVPQNFVQPTWPAFRDAFQSKLGRVAVTGVPDQPLWLALRPGFIRDTLAQLWPPVTVADQEWKAIRQATADLDRLPEANAAFFMAADAIQAVARDVIADRGIGLSLPEGLALTLSQTSLSFERQAISLTTDFALGSASPSVTVVGKLAGTVAIALVDKRLYLYPVFETIELTTVSYPPAPVDLNVTVPAINDLLKQVLANLNGALAAKPLSPIPVHLDPLAPVDFAEQLRRTSGISNVTSKPLPIDLRLGGASLLVDDEGIHGIAVLQGEAAAAIPAAERADIAPTPDAASIVEAFNVLRASFGVALPQGEAAAAILAAPQSDTAPTPDAASIVQAFNALRASFLSRSDAVSTRPVESVAAWVAISKALLATILNESLDGLDLCGTYALDGKAVPIPRTKLELFKSGAISCPVKQDDRECGQRACVRKKDTRNCKRTISIPLLGRRKVNDPVCEAAKATQNQIYLRDLDACNTKRAGKKAACEAAKTAQNVAYAAEKAACESWKALVKQAGDYGAVDGNIALEGKPRACLRGAQFASDLSSVHVDAGLDIGLIGVSGSLHYVPHNIPGYAGCPAEWKKPFKATVATDLRRLDFDIALEPKTTADGLDLHLTIPSQEVKLQMRPRPYEAIFVENPDLVVRCPGTAAVGGAATLLNEAYFGAIGKDLIPELRGEHTHESKAMPLAITIPALSEVVGNAVKLRYRPVWISSGKALELVADLEKKNK